jgi:acyl carrier protein
MSDLAIDKLRDAFVTALGISPSTNFESLTYGQSDHWDSVAHMDLITQIEAAFEIRLATDEVVRMSSFLKAKEIVAYKGVDFT